MTTKQQASIVAIEEGITKRLGELPEFIQEEQNGAVLMLADGWPTIKVGKNGGIDLVEIKSFPNPLEAAINGDTLLKKQNERAAKRRAEEELAQKKAAEAAEKAAQTAAVAEEITQDKQEEVSA